jgi:2-keto-4-pentenoate hydratase/2-oxohepta-3-ene-1,7-dioic acid hydratase in catechol pathway
MKIVAYEIDGRPGIGELSADETRIVPLRVNAALARDGVLGLIEENLDVHGGIERDDNELAIAAVQLRAPIPRPRRNIFCVGKNYVAHVKEFERSGFDSGAGLGEIPADPIIFSKLPDCVIAAGDAILYNETATEALDYEAELGVIIARAGRGIPQNDALDHVWGYTIINDVTARDVQKRHKQWLLGKSQDTFCPMGPWAVTKDALDLADTDVRCWVNGELRQSGNTRELIFDVPTLIATISLGITLRPGDVIATGTPAGVGAGFDPPRFLKAGDQVRIEIPPIGILENTVAALN